MKVFLLGGTGAIGRPAVDALVAAGHDVSALARSPERARTLRAFGARPVEISMFDLPALTQAFVGHDAVVNLASAMPSTVQFVRLGAWRDTQRIRTVGSALVVDAALASDVSMLVQESVAMLYADKGDSWIDEHAAVDRYPMAQGNHAAEASAERFTSAGRTGIVLRFGLFYGPGARHSEQFLAMARLGVVPVLGHPSGYLSSIHVADGGRAVPAVLSAAAGVYNVVDDEPLTKRSYADALAHGAGRRPWLRAPGRLAQLLGHRTTSLTRSIRVTNAKLTAATGWAPEFPSAREGWLATATALQRGR
ncbi:MAG TPA: NAD(P)-dependent oxidoreductase [Microthrixaceae bacterium]|nr:NAD(P)-dependent oxidoreductase [Microthrixaceae bacterium]